MAYSIAGKTFTDYKEAFQFYWMVAEEIMAEAILNTPISGDKVRPMKNGVELPRLVDSYYVGKFGDAPNNIFVANTCPYAVFVHELIFNAHEVGQAKFLEDAAWDVGNKHKVKTYIRLFPVTPNMPTSQAITCYLDYGKKGFDIAERRRQAQVLFARYYKWRCENRDRRLKKLEEQIKTIRPDKMAEHLAKITTLKERDAYEKEVYPILLDAMKKWKESTGRLTYDVPDNKKFAVPLSKYFGSIPYSKAVLEFGKQFEDIIKKVEMSGDTDIISGISGISAISNDEVRKLMEQLQKDSKDFLGYMNEENKRLGSNITVSISSENISDISDGIDRAINIFGDLVDKLKKEDDEKYNFIMHEISLGNESIIEKIDLLNNQETEDLLERDEIDKAIDEMLNNFEYDTDWFDLDTGRFIGGSMKMPKSGRLKIKTFHSGKTTNRWEDVE